jgi:hypothetical protein
MSHALMADDKEWEFYLALIKEGIAVGVSK